MASAHVCHFRRETEYNKFYTFFLIAVPECEGAFGHDTETEGCFVLGAVRRSEWGMKERRAQKYERYICVINETNDNKKYCDCFRELIASTNIGRLKLIKCYSFSIIRRKIETKIITY